jgi:hypothetical protein
VAEGGLQPDGWDEPLADELRTKLEIGPNSFEDELTAKGVTTEALVHALLETLEPFSAMMVDLLGLFERHGIERADGSAEMLFDFEAPGRPPLSFDLESFRRAREVWERVKAPTLELEWLQHHAWPLLSVLRGTIAAGDWDQPRAATAQWFDAYRQDGEWPPTPLAVPPSGSRPLDGALTRAASSGRRSLSLCARGPRTGSRSERHGTSTLHRSCRTTTATPASSTGWPEWTATTTCSCWQPPVPRCARSSGQRPLGRDAHAHRT